MKLELDISEGAGWALCFICAVIISFVIGHYINAYTKLFTDAGYIETSIIGVESPVWQKPDCKEVMHE